MPELAELLYMNIPEVLHLDSYKRVDLDPNNVKTLNHVISILAELDNYKKQTGEEAAVGEYVNIHLGRVYRINSRKDIENRNTGKVQWYQSCYPYSYFEDLKKRLVNKK
ncbi:MAG: hypothetical protein PHT91_01265 [Candidatus Nanoarchaeia archaeon]|nr:hypothetical protein [Candidatus Nanoarchaeia archaeon]MDD5054112.1 hypothetical protein [Candidatus Nanoarchaeia archaeon]MDD5499488.1 hypothetical protein [Candidatus Nanoarchaeia archaeon]